MYGHNLFPHLRDYQIFSPLGESDLSWHIISFLLLYANKSGLLPLFVPTLVLSDTSAFSFFNTFCVCGMASDLISLLHVNESILSKCRHLPTSLWLLVCCLGIYILQYI